jgi:hypothetical protein
MQETALVSQLREATALTNTLEGAVHSLKLRIRFRPGINLRMETRLLVLSLRLLSAQRTKRRLTQKLREASRRPLTR